MISACFLHSSSVLSRELPEANCDYDYYMQIFCFECVLYYSKWADYLMLCFNILSLSCSYKAFDFVIVIWKHLEECKLLILVSILFSIYMYILCAYLYAFSVDNMYIGMRVYRYVYVIYIRMYKTQSSFQAHSKQRLKLVVIYMRAYRIPFYIPGITWIYL